MTDVFLSPHYDDAVFSCGGLIWELSQQGADVEIMTICAAEPQEGELSPFAQELHRRWGLSMREGVQVRQREDIQAAAILGVKRREFPLQDCIYRRTMKGEFLYQSEAALFGELHPAESGLIPELSRQLSAAMPRAARLISPLGVGNHVDHQLTRRIAEACGIELWYYAEIPYIFRQPRWREKYLSSFCPAIQIAISDAGMQAWVKAAEAYASQLSTFWTNEDELRQALEGWARTSNGGILWRKNRKKIIVGEKVCGSEIL